MTILNWEKSGRSYVARIGRLTLTIKKGYARLGLDAPWNVREVFGVTFVDNTDYPTFREATEAAERIAMRFAKELTEWLALVDTAKKNMDTTRNTQDRPRAQKKNATV